MANVLNDPRFARNADIAMFLSDNDVGAVGQSEMSSFGTLRQVVLQGEDTKGAEAKKPIAAAYYTSWSSWSNPPNKIDFSKFDILFYGAPQRVHTDAS